MNQSYQSIGVDTLLAGRTPIDIGLWGIAFLAILAAIVLMLRSEKRQFSAKGKGSSWLWLRLWTLPILILTVVAVLPATRLVSGMEALFYFYVALFTLAPIVWFGSHWVIGSMLKPNLTKSESTSMALMGLLILIGTPIVIGMLQGPLFLVSHRLNERILASVDHAPLPLDPQPSRHFRLGDAGDIYTQTFRAPAGIHIERIEALLGSGWNDTKTMWHAYFCRQGEDLHMAWSNGMPPPLKLFWHDANGERRQSELRLDPAVSKALPVIDFVVGWRNDGIDLPVPIHRDNIQLGWRNEGGIYYRPLNPLQKGESFENDCVMKGYNRAEWRTEGPIAAMTLRFQSLGQAETLHYEIER